MKMNDFFYQVYIYHNKGVSSSFITGYFMHYKAVSLFLIKEYLLNKLGVSH